MSQSINKPSDYCLTRQGTGPTLPTSAAIWAEERGRLHASTAKAKNRLTEKSSRPTRNLGESILSPLPWLLLLTWLFFSGLLLWKVEAITRGMT